MSIRIVKQGLMDTLQDEGRYGYADLGVNPGGAMDRVAMQVANALVGNPLNEAVLEMHFPAAEMLFETNALIALAGATATVTINGEEVRTMHPILIRTGSLLTIGTRIEGARIYLAVKGGFDVKPWLGSASTHLKAQAGGFEGRRLRTNDHLSLRQPWADKLHEEYKLLPWSADVRNFYSREKIRFVKGKDHALLDASQQRQFTNQAYSITPRSDRMGYRLQSGPLRCVQQASQLSFAVTRGTLQLLPDGQLILLMADHQTTGGYPVPAHVIAADLPALAQRGAGESFQFEEVTHAYAETAWCEQQMNLHQLQNACTFRLNEWFA